MAEFFIYFLAFILGIVLGAVFFGGLWLTVNKGLTSKYPAIWFALSLIVRMAIVLSGFYFIVSELNEGIPALRLLASLVGLLVARKVITKKGSLGLSLPDEKL